MPFSRACASCCAHATSRSMISRAASIDADASATLSWMVGNSAILLLPPATAPRVITRAHMVQDSCVNAPFAAPMAALPRQNGIAHEERNVEKADALVSPPARRSARGRIREGSGYGARARRRLAGSGSWNRYRPDRPHPRSPRSCSRLAGTRRKDGTGTLSFDFWRDDGSAQCPLRILATARKGPIAGKAKSAFHALGHARSAHRNHIQAHWGSCPRLPAEPVRRTSQEATDAQREVPRPSRSTRKPMTVRYWHRRAPQRSPVHRRNVPGFTISKYPTPRSRSILRAGTRPAFSVSRAVARISSRTGAIRLARHAFSARIEAGNKAAVLLTWNCPSVMGSKRRVLWRAIIRSFHTLMGWSSSERRVSITWPMKIVCVP